MRLKDLNVTLRNPYEEEIIPEICEVIKMPQGRVFEALKPEWNSWCTSQPVVIKAPTGAGKTTFVAQIVKKILQTPYKSLYLCNRTAIAQQQKQIFCKIANSTWHDIDDPAVFEKLSYFEDIHLTVMTYQKFAASWTHMDLSSYRWVFLDECHFFYADALFNPHLDSLFFRLPSLFQHAHRIYLSATPDRALQNICKAERDNINLCRRCHYCSHVGKVRLYSFSFDFQHISLHYFRKTNEIISLIHRNPQDKFLIFANSRNDMSMSQHSSYLSALSSAGISFTYLDSTSKGSEDWKEICSSEKFDSQVLVCTSVLDCGVNLHDSKLRHIIVETYDKTEFFQMIGRKRCKSSEHINVYVRAIQKNTLRSHLRRITQMSSLLRTDCSSNPDFILFRGWNDESPDRPYLHLFNYDGHGKVSVKVTANTYLEYQRAAVVRLLRDEDSYSDGSALPRLVHTWLNNPDGYSEQNWLTASESSDLMASLVSFLEAAIGSQISSKEIDDFCARLQNLILPLYNEVHDGSRQLGYRALNNRLIDLGLAYQISRGDSCFLVQGKGGDVNDLT